ncbi:MAG: hypothetical protein INR73_13300 [Williamsia sp.]|nr:hypothetical protein [Williamsia sp.]
MRQVLIVLLSALVLLCCRKQVADDANIYRSWQWVNSVGGFTGQDVIKPASNTVVTLTFWPNMTYTAALNGQIAFRGTFHIATPGSQKILLLDNYTPINRLYMVGIGESISISNNELHLTDYQVSEPYTHKFK